MNLKLILIVGAAVVVLGGGGFAAYRFLPWFRPKPPATVSAPAAAPRATPAPPAAPAAPASGTSPTVVTPVPAAASSGSVAAARPAEGELRLVRLYEGMKPKEAATVMAKLDPELSTTILLGMRERQAGKILGLLPPEKAADLTDRIARVRSEAPAKQVTR
jgi:hypothetical protein